MLKMYGFPLEWKDNNCFNIGCECNYELHINDKKYYFQTEKKGFKTGAMLVGVDVEKYYT